MTTKQAIHEIVEGLSEEEAERLLAFLRDEEPEDYPDELIARIEQSRAELAHGEFVTQDEFERKYLS
jgi:hypothetical protein